MSKGFCCFTVDDRHDAIGHNSPWPFSLPETALLLLRKFLIFLCTRRQDLFVWRALLYPINSIEDVDFSVQSQPTTSRRVNGSSLITVTVKNPLATMIVTVLDETYS
jgi:hypothetical protein